MGPTYGIGLVSRLPVERWVRIPLGTSPVSLPLLVDARRPALVRDEPRLGLAAVLAPGAPVGTVVATHLSFAPGFNVAQLTRLVRAVRRLPRPVVLLGDLNMPGPVPTAVLPRWRSLAREATFPAALPRIQFDHALVRDHPDRPLPAVAAFETVLTPISDHRALAVDLATRPSPGPRSATVPITITAGGRTPASAMAPGSSASVARVARCAGQPAVAVTATPGSPASRPFPTAARRRSRRCVSTAISSTSVPRSRADAAQSTSDSRLPGRHVPGDDDELVRDAAVGDRDPGQRGHRDGAGDARHHLDRDARGDAGLQLLAAAAEHERVAALEPHDRTGRPARAR